MKTYAIKIDLPDEILNVLQTLNSAGFEAYVAGGAVRNFLLGRKIEDYDITTNATPSNVKKLFKKSFDTGINHGTVTVVTKNFCVEVTTYRIDKDYKDHRRPENVEFTKKLEDDLARRDFTINALVYNPDEGIIDAFCSVDDINNKRIKAVNDADLRFYEDALRILRGVRFSCTLGFNIEDKTLSAMEKNAKYLSDISVERIREEFTKILFSNYFEKIYPLLKTNIFKPVLSDIYNLKKEHILKIKIVPNDFCLKWALFIYYTNRNNCDDFLRKYKFSNYQKKKISFFIKNSCYSFNNDKIDIKTFMRNNNTFIDDFSIFLNLIGKYFPVKVYREILESNEAYNIKMLDITGFDIKKIAHDERKIGKVLEHLLDFVIQNPDKNKKEILTIEAEKVLWKLDHMQK